MVTNIPIIFQGSFAALASIGLYNSALLVQKNKHSPLLFTIGVLLLLTGGALWLIDQLLCDKLKSLRAFLGYPLKPLCQAHAWWHFFFQSGSYVGLLFGIHARNCHLNRDCELLCFIRVIPVVTHRKTPLLPSYTSWTTCCSKKILTVYIDL